MHLVKDGFQRDCVIIDNLLQSHFHPSGAGLNVKDKTHLELKEYQRDHIKKRGFKLPALPIYDFEDKALPVDLSFDRKSD